MMAFSIQIDALIRIFPVPPVRCIDTESQDESYFRECRSYLIEFAGDISEIISVFIPPGSSQTFADIGSHADHEKAVTGIVMFTHPVDDPAGEYHFVESFAVDENDRTVDRPADL